MASPSGSTDPAADEKVRLQLAIFDVTREADGKSMAEIREMLHTAFSRHGVAAPPATWVESVASSAFYGEPYIVDLSAAVTADAMVPAPDDGVRETLAARRELQQEKLPADIFPSPSEWNIPAADATGGSTGTASLTKWDGGLVLAVAALVATAVVAVIAARVSRRPTGSGRS